MPAAEPTPSEANLKTQLLLAFFCGVAYFYAFQLNAYWFDWFEFSPGANWVFIPSGLRFLFVLVLARLGMVSIALSSIAVNYSYGSSDAHLFNVVTGLISGLSPYLARHVALTWLKLDTQLSNLNGRLFLQMSILFAIVNALTHQLWFFCIGQTQDFLASTMAMGMGDWFGTVLVLAAARLSIQGFKRIHTP
jgi:hypothetical protein